MEFIADLEIHSKYSRAVSKEMELPNLAKWAAIKGIRVVGTGDFTHPLWFSDIKEKLEPAEPGLFKLRREFYPLGVDGLKIEDVRFLLTAEISCIYSKGGKVRKIHHLVWAPSFEAVEKVNARLALIGNLKSDGRPILGLDSRELLKICLWASPKTLLVPAHIWTPWFAIFGSKSGFDSLEECFDELTPQVFAVETGLSSDPAMNWRVPFLDNKAIISSSDSHSLMRLGREATIFNTDFSFDGIREAIISRSPERISSTVEFFPEEGRYHYDGHANCKISLHPEETRKYNGLCPNCGRPVTVGVMARVEELAARPASFKPDWAIKFDNFIPLDEVIAQSLGVTTSNTKRVQLMYLDAVKKFGSEFQILKNESAGDLVLFDEVLAEAILRMRAGRIHIEPGYDGEYGRIRIFSDEERKDLEFSKTGQSQLF